MTAEDVAARMETAFMDRSMVAVSTERELQLSLSQDDAFNQLFQGFMGIGLIVGVAAIGVLSFRAVEERRQSIGMLRALGFRSRMVLIQFLLGGVVRDVDRHRHRSRPGNDDLVEYLQ